MESGFSWEGEDRSLHWPFYPVHFGAVWEVSMMGRGNEEV